MRRIGQTSSPPGAWGALDRALIRWWEKTHSDKRWNYVRITLSPFMKWCAAKAIAPECVTDRLISGYVASKTFKRKDYDAAHEKFLRRRWNIAASEVVGWPTVHLSEPPERHELPTERGDHIITFAVVQFHPSLVAEVERFRAAGGFLFDQVASEVSHRERMEARLQSLVLRGSPRQRPTRMLRPLSYDTLYTSCRIIYMTATALHLSGEARLAELQSIADVMTPKGAAALADSCEARLGQIGGRRAAARNVKYFHSIAMRCGLYFTMAEREVLRDLNEDLFGYEDRGNGISERNLRKLMQFEDDRIFSMLIALPGVIFGELESSRHQRGGSPTYDEAAQARWAIAIELLNTLPIRRETLVSLDAMRNFVRPKGGAPRFVIFADQEKTGNLLEARLPERTWRMVALYRRQYRPLLEGAESSSFLFPGRATGHMVPQALAHGITRLVRDRIGVHANPHIWRHLMSSKLGR